MLPFQLRIGQRSRVKPGTTLFRQFYQRLPPAQLWRGLRRRHGRAGQAQRLGAVRAHQVVRHGEGGEQAGLLALGKAGEDIGFGGLAVIRAGELFQQGSIGIGVLAEVDRVPFPLPQPGLPGDPAERIVERAELIDEAKLAGGSAVPDTALRDPVDVGESLAA